MTMYKAKGLEPPHVFFLAWEAGNFPSSFGEPVEGRRLGYVAITRGMRRVTLSHCGFRRGPASPSLFIDDIPQTHRVHGWLSGPNSVDTTAKPARPGRRTLGGLARWL
jgi:DNA helicase-2/ATP-dependent DNA helicase PcrA